MFKRLVASLVCLTFIFSNLQYVQAQDYSVNQLPIPGTMVGESAPFSPLALKGLIVNLQKPLEFQFIVDTGKGPQDRASIKEEANQLVKYFLAGLTIPEGDIWVNLSPYEKRRMLPTALGQTDLGRDLLAQDYILKQLTASLIYPEKSLGKEFWNRVYAKAQAQFGTTNIPVNTFNKVWILPDQAQVYENVNDAYVTQSTLKVMLDEDYLALHKHMPKSNGTDSIGSQIVRAIILPEIEKEVNTGKNFAPLRQIYQALILAKWYKETIQNGLLDAVYTNKNKIAGVNLNDPTLKEQIYERYLKAYKKGAFNYIKEGPTLDGQNVPRKYFSGGEVMVIHLKRTKSAAMLTKVLTAAVGSLLLFTVGCSSVNNTDLDNRIALIKTQTTMSTNEIKGLIVLVREKDPQKLLLNLKSIDSNSLDSSYRFLVPELYKVMGQSFIPEPSILDKLGRNLANTLNPDFGVGWEQRHGVDYDNHQPIWVPRPDNAPYPGKEESQNLDREIHNVAALILKKINSGSNFLNPAMSHTPQQTNQDAAMSINQAEINQAIATFTQQPVGILNIYQRAGLDPLLMPLNLELSPELAWFSEEIGEFKSHALFNAAMTKAEVDTYANAAMSVGMRITAGIGKVLSVVGGGTLFLSAIPGIVSIFQILDAYADASRNNFHVSHDVSTYWAHLLYSILGGVTGFGVFILGMSIQDLPEIIFYKEEVRKFSTKYPSLYQKLLDRLSVDVKDGRQLNRCIALFSEYAIKINSLGHDFRFEYSSGTSDYWGQDPYTGPSDINGVTYGKWHSGNPSTFIIIDTTSNQSFNLFKEKTSKPEGDAAMQINVPEDFPKMALKFDSKEHKELGVIGDEGLGMGEVLLDLRDQDTRRQLQKLVEIASLQNVRYAQARLIFTANGEDPYDMGIGLYDDHFLPLAFINLIGDDEYLYNYMTLKVLHEQMPMRSNTAVVSLTGIRAGISKRNQTVLIEPNAAMLNLTPKQTRDSAMITGEEFIRMIPAYLNAVIESSKDVGAPAHLKNDYYFATAIALWLNSNKLATVEQSKLIDFLLKKIDIGDVGDVNLIMTDTGEHVPIFLGIDGPKIKWIMDPKQAQRVVYAILQYNKNAAMIIRPFDVSVLQWEKEIPLSKSVYTVATLDVRQFMGHVSPIRGLTSVQMVYWTAKNKSLQPLFLILRAENETRIFWADPEIFDAKILQNEVPERLQGLNELFKDYNFRFLTGGFNEWHVLGYVTGLTTETDRLNVRLEYNPAMLSDDIIHIFSAWIESKGQAAISDSEKVTMRRTLAEFPSDLEKFKQWQYAINTIFSNDEYKKFKTVEQMLKFLGQLPGMGTWIVEKARMIERVPKKGSGQDARLKFVSENLQSLLHEFVRFGDSLFSGIDFKPTGRISRSLRLEFEPTGSRIPEFSRMLSGQDPAMIHQETLGPNEGGVEFSATRGQLVKFKLGDNDELRIRNDEQGNPILEPFDLWGSNFGISWADGTRNNKIILDLSGGNMRVLNGVNAPIKVSFVNTQGRPMSGVIQSETNAHLHNAGNGEIRIDFGNRNLVFKKNGTKVSLKDPYPILDGTIVRLGEVTPDPKSAIIFGNEGWHRYSGLDVVKMRVEYLGKVGPTLKISTNAAMAAMQKKTEGVFSSPGQEARKRKSSFALAHTNLENGGIDLNQINIKRNGNTIKIQFDPAQLNQIVKGGFKGFSFKIESMTPISNPYQLLGINRPIQEIQLAKI